MNPSTKITAAVIQKIGRRLSSTYGKNNIKSIGRITDFIGSVSSSQVSENQILTSPRSHLRQSAQYSTEVVKTEKRSKSSMAIEYDEPDETVNAALANATYDQSVREPFPSIVIGPEQSIEPQGSFAEAQAEVRKNDRKRRDEIRLNGMTPIF